jgi:YD repeat-containing protein
VSRINHLLFLCILIIIFGCTDSSEKSSAAGYRISKFLKLDSAGGLISTMTITYNEIGQVIRKERDSNGEIDLVIEYMYKSDGKSEGMEIDLDADGVFDEFSVPEYSNDGLLIKSTTYVANNDEIQAIETLEYDTSKKLISVLVDFTNDNYLGGDFTITLSYDADGIIITYEYPAAIHRYYYETSGRLGSIETDTDKNGSADSIEQPIYEQGKCIPPDPVSINAFMCAEE